MVNRERLYRTEAIILKRTDFGEADRLLTLYTPYLGKIRAIAKGVRKPTSRKSGHVELLTHSRLLVARGRGLDIVTQAETIHSFKPLREDLLRTTYGYYAVELLDRFVGEGVENRPLFDLLVATLSRLGETDDLDLTARFYELRLLAFVGYRPQLFTCVECRGKVEGEASIYFSPSDGGVICHRCYNSAERRGAKAISLGALKVMRFLQTRDYDICRRLRISPRLHGEIESVMERYISHLLERNLKSLEFLRRLRRESSG
jgi:DNA repair protein RecO (recombination protein O)